MSLLFDIGANMGAYTRAHLHAYDRIVLVEPQADLCTHLRSSLPDKCTVVSAIISNETKVPFYRNTLSHTIATAAVDWTTASRFQHHGSWVKCDDLPTRTLDSLVAEFGTPTYIKVDVEGYEKAVLLSLTKKWCPLAFEWAEESLLEIEAALAHLHSIGYTQFHLQMEDAYMYTPTQYVDYPTFTQQFRALCQPSRKQLWGMIHCV